MLSLNSILTAAYTFILNLFIVGFIFLWINKEDLDVCNA
jgi:hypothetical protein